MYHINYKEVINIELRKDYFLDRWVIIAENRKNTGKKKNICPFCAGNEKESKEIDRVEKNGRWVIRCVENKFPAVSLNKIKGTNKNLLQRKTAYGYHEVIIDSNDHKKQLYDYDWQHIKLLLKFFIKRINELSKDDKIKYIAIFKNHDKGAGTSIDHSHCQLIAYNLMPEHLIKESKAMYKFKECPYCKIIKLERKTKRKIFETKTM